MANRYNLALLNSIACLIVIGMCGCGPAGTATAPISGQVTFDGAPLESGTVYLRRKDGEFFSVDIAAGKFAGQAMPGEYRVEISAIREETPSATALAMYGPDAPRRQMNYIPAKYNTDSTLTATIDANGSEDLSFQLTGS